jgi:hypothetical protein
MGGTAGKYKLVAAILAMLALGGVTPAGAAYTKLYSFPNATGASQTSVKVITNGLESIIAQTSTPSGWSPAKMGSTVLSGVYNTTITFGGTAVANGTQVTAGWQTADNSCRLRDLRWGGGQAIVPTQLGGVPGGGLVFYDYPNPGDLTVVITNDTTGPLTLSGVEYGTSQTELDLDQLGVLARTGLVGLRVDAIDQAIDVLRAEVAYHGSLGELPSPSANSLDGKLSKAAAYKDSGLAAYLAGSSGRAFFLWQKAAQQMQTFISEVTNLNDKANLIQYLYLRWVVEGGEGLPMTALEIREALSALPNGPSLLALPALPPGTPLPSYAGLDPADYVQWPVTVLNPGEYTAFVLSNVDLGSGLILRGSVRDASGADYLDWIEQGVAEPSALDTTPPEIVSASATPSFLWPPDHAMVNVVLDAVVVDDSYAVWYVAGVTSNQPVNGTGSGDTSPDWQLDPSNVQTLWLREERSGSDPTQVRVYTITLMAVDAAGNLSAPYQLLVPVNHDNSTS